MAAPADLSELINRGTGGNSGTPRQYFVLKTSPASGTTAGRWHSYWTRVGFYPRAGVAPTTAVVPTNTTEGSLKQTDASGGRSLWLTAGIFQNTVPIGGTIVYDRLSHQGGLSGTAGGAQTTNLPTAALTRNTGGTGNMILLEIYTGVGATPQTVTASYTNTASTAGRTTQAVAIGGTGNQEAAKIIPLPWQSGDTGVKSVESVTLSGSTAAAGDFGVIIANPLLIVSHRSSPSLMDLMFRTEGPQQVEDGACIAFVGAGALQSTPFSGQLFMLEQ